MYTDQFCSESCYSCIDETDSFGFKDENYHDSIFGIRRNEKKKAEKKVRKAEKQLEKGHIKAAERKLKKAAPILEKLAASQQNVIASKQKTYDINATQDYIKAMQPRQTESMQTTAGQIGSEAGATVTESTTAMKAGMLGSGGDISSGGGGGDSSSDIDSTDTGVETSTALQPKELSGVTVTAKKTNWLLIGSALIAVLLIIFFAPKLFKK